MRDYVIITDATADLTPEMVRETGVSVIPMEVVLGGKTFFHYFDAREMGFHEFYEKVRAGTAVSTVQINPMTYAEEFERHIKNGLDVLYIAFSSGLSGSYANSVIVVNELSEKYPDAKIYAIDSLSAALGQGLLVCHAAMLKKQGKSIDEVREYVLDAIQHHLHWVTVDDLNHLKRGGRVSPAAAFAGTLLGIKPIIHVDKEGHLIPVAKARGRRAGIEVLFKHFVEQAINPEKQQVFIGHADCNEDAKFLGDMIRQKYKNIDLRIGYIGPVIGAHAGPGTLALFFVAENRDAQ